MNNEQQQQQLNHQRSSSSIQHRPNNNNIIRSLLTKSPIKAQSTTNTTTSTNITLSLSSTPQNIPQEPPATARSIQKKTHPEEQATQPRKYHILTNAGKPVWSTEKEDEDRPDGDLTSQMGLIQAVISIFEADDHDQLRYIDAGQTKIAVMSRPPLYFLAVSNWGEPESTLRMHLEYLNLLIQSILSTTQLQKIFEQRPNYDLRGGLSGTESIFNGLVDRLQWDLSIMMASLTVYRCPPQIRDRISKLITPLNHSNLLEPQNDSFARKLLYSIVISNAQVVSVVRPKNHSVHPSDLQIIMTTILSSKSIKSSESWIPICLPGYNPTGFLHAYVNFEPGGKEVGLVLISKDRAGFYDAQRWAREIFKDPIWAEFHRLRSPLHPDSPPSLLSTSSSSSSSSSSKKPEDNHQPSSPPPSVQPLPSLKNPACGQYFLEDLGIPGLRHFIFKDKKFVQVSFPAWEDDYLIESNRQRLMTNYQKAFDLIHPKQPKLIKRINTDPTDPSSPDLDQDLPSSSFNTSTTLPPPIKFTLFKTQFESVIGWINESHEIYVTVSPLISKSASILIVHSIVNWIKVHHQSLFLTSTNQF
ncbi:Vacuolar fusion protein mon1 [Puccinia graminis f. sp. tritici]|uniref:Vacuolar fusion protein MON1 n=2 Tax=Puccinia graminis f. sp. tritici TaxID=56615 RepID=A0A5B0SDK9_PUCGR|nr:Vacuolar fusion protein mon1 [Puccinia graminis f. sp. tritici]